MGSQCIKVQEKTILYLFDAGSLLIVDKNQKCWFSLKYTDEKLVTLKCPRVVYIRALRAKNICQVAYKVITLHSSGSGVDSTLPPEQPNNFRAQNHLIISAEALHGQQQNGDGYIQSWGHIITCCDIHNEIFILAQYTVVCLKH